MDQKQPPLFPLAVSLSHQPRQSRRFLRIPKARLRLKRYRDALKASKPASIQQ